MSSWIKLLFMFFVTLVFVMFTATCNKTQFGASKKAPEPQDPIQEPTEKPAVVIEEPEPTEEPPETEKPESPTPDQVKASCDDAKSKSKLKSMKQTVAFKSDNGCEWSLIANPEWSAYPDKITPDAVASIVQGKNIESVIIDLPTDVEVCDIEFDAKPQGFVYDDEITLTLNNYILFSTMIWPLSDSNPNGLVKNNENLYSFKWDAPNGFFGQLYDDRDAVINDYCIGTTCQIPETETPGEIIFDIPEDRIIDLIQLSKKGQSKFGKEIEFKFITIGDNDGAKDCRHSGFEFDLDIYYIQK